MDVFEQGLAVDVAAASGWWLIARPAGEEPPVGAGGGGLSGGGDGGVAVAGPFAERLDAEAAALAAGPDTAGVRVAYGARCGDGTLLERSTPGERAWLAGLGWALDRLGEDWALPEDDPRVSLVVELAAALTDAGLPLHDAAPGTAPHTAIDDTSREVLDGAGGVSLTPTAGGVVVAWRAHDRLDHERVRGAAATAAVGQAMGAALAGVLTALGFQLRPLAGSSAHLVPVSDR